MSLKCQVVLMWVICLSCKVVLTSCKVVLVNRNVTDSFRVGEDGCTNDTSVCKSSATCQSDGLCLCNSKTPSYRNPVLKINGSEIVYGDSYGCIDNKIIRFAAGNKSTFCYFSPFQVIPYSFNEPATEFSYELPNKLHNCSLWSTCVKCPDNETEIKLPWLNESCVNLTVLNNTMYFWWKKSVSNLQGTIITFNLICNNSLSFNYSHCIRAKVLGTWSADNTSTCDQTTILTTPDSTLSARSSSATDHTSTSEQMTTPRATSSARRGSPGEISSSDGDSSSTIIILAIVIPVVVLILLVVVVWFCCKCKKRNSQRNPSRESSEKKDETSTRRPFRHTESNLRGPIAYVDLLENDTTETFGAHTNPTCPTPDNQSVIVEANPCYGTVDIHKSSESNEVNFYSHSDYEPEDLKMDEVKACTFNSDPDYATVDIKRKDVDGNSSYAEPGYETPDVKRKDFDATNSYSDAGINGATSKSDADYATVDIKRKGVDGNSSYADRSYATPDAKRKDFDATNSYSDPNYESVDIKMKGVNGASSKSHPDYATVDVKRKDVDGNNSYAEPGYETPDVKRKDFDGATSSTENNYETIAELVDRTVKNKEENATTYQPELGYETSDTKKENKVNGDSSYSAHPTRYSDVGNVEENAAYSPSHDIKRIEVNGDLYALPNKQK